jgi:flagellar export protein FliJ
MRSFRFPLESALKWRGAQLLAEEARLMPLVAERTRLDALRDEITAARERAQRELFAGGPVDGGELAALAGYRARLEKERTAVERQSAQCRENMAAQRARVVEAHRRLRLMEKLRERRLKEWRTAAERETEALASEAFLAQWHGRRGR